MVRIAKTLLGAVKLIETDVYADARGTFIEAWNDRAFEAVIGAATFLQDNLSTSAPWVMRGIHYQLRHPQGKLVRCISGGIFDVVVDLRRGSPTFGRWAGTHLYGGDGLSLWIPPGFGHAFLALEAGAQVLYKTTERWFPGDERTLAWDDPTLAIPWPLPEGVAPLTSEKDGQGAAFAEAEVYEGPLRAAGGMGVRGGSSR